jgi:hypothetical protein
VLYLYCNKKSILFYIFKLIKNIITIIVMIESLIVIIIVGILGIIVLFLRYNFGDPFESCGRRVYIEG